jgi:outer membrane cobalamin receptor
LDAYIDLGLGLTYLYNDALSARLRFDNALFQEYQIAYGYAVVPFQASLLLSYRF